MGRKVPFYANVHSHDQITYAKFVEDRLRGLGGARGQISGFPIDLHSGSLQHSSLPHYRAGVPSVDAVFYLLFLTTDSELVIGMLLNTAFLWSKVF